VTSPTLPLKPVGKGAGLYPQRTFFPETGSWPRCIRLSSGARVFKIHAQVGGFDLRAPDLDAVWGLLADTATPVIVHVGSGPVRGRPSPDRTSSRECSVAIRS